MAQWLLNGGVEEEYDQFVATLKKMGVDEYIKMHDEALNRFNS